jgi:hypothetical protein
MSMFDLCCRTETRTNMSSELLAVLSLAWRIKAAVFANKILSKPTHNQGSDSYRTWFKSFRYFIYEVGIYNIQPVI